MNISKAFLDGNFNPEYFRYCFDRAAENEAGAAENQAVNTSNQEQSNAAAERSTLLPFYRQEMNAQHAFDPTQTNELLNYAGAGAGGAASAATGEANSQAARTRNTSGFSSALDQNARQRQQTMGNLNEGIGAEDVTGAKRLNQEGAAGMAGLEGTDTRATLEAMGQEAPDINAQVNAGKSGWFQNMDQLIATLTGGAKNLAQADQAMNAND
jgi:hypothetical protein